MKIYYISFISAFSLCLGLNSFSQITCLKNVKFNSVSYDVCSFRADSLNLSRFNILQNASNLKPNDFIDEQIINGSDIVFATNACISDKNGEAMGLMVNNRIEIKKINLRDGDGNFFLKPNGVLSIYKDSVKIVESTKFSKNQELLFAVQSGPMLLLNGKIHNKFDPSSKNKFIRSGVGLVKNAKDSDTLIFCKTNEPVSFYEFAQLFKNRYQCFDALILESELSVMYSENTPLNDIDKEKIVSNYLVLQNTIQSSTQKNIVKMIKTNSGVYVIPITLNGVLKINFIFDSGASDISISPDVALTLIRTGTIEKDDFIGTQTYKFANGQTATSEVFYLKEVQIGDRIIKRVKASIADNIEAPMLLGQSVLQRLGKFSIDNKNHTLIID